MRKTSYSLYKSCRQWSIESIYEFSAESSHAFSRKSPKTSKNLIFGHKRAQKFFFGFFGENPASSLFYTWNRLTCCKKSEKSNDRKYENFCYGQTDRRTDWRSRFHKDSRVLKTVPDSCWCVFQMDRSSAGIFNQFISYNWEVESDVCDSRFTWNYFIR